MMYLVVLRAVMLMIDETFKRIKLICLLLARLIGHTYSHPLKVFRLLFNPYLPGPVDYITRYLVPWQILVHWLFHWILFTDDWQLFPCGTKNTDTDTQKKMEGPRDREQKRKKFCSKGEVEEQRAVPSWWYFTLNKQAEPHREREASIYPAPIIIHPLLPKFTFWHSIRTL